MVTKTNFKALWRISISSTSSKLIYDKQGVLRRRQEVTEGFRERRQSGIKSTLNFISH